MLTDYLNAALEMAEYEIIDDPEPFYGHIPTVEGVWATGKTLESCRRNLASAVEDWVFFSVARGFALPAIGGITIVLPERLAA